MVVRTIQLSFTLIFLTRPSLVDIGVVFLFLPTVVLFAASLHRTALFILSNESFRLPVLAGDKYVIVVELGLSSKVLPVMSIVALCFIVLFIERAPFSFKVKHVEVCIFLHKMDDS